MIFFFDNVFPFSFNLMIFEDESLLLTEDAQPCMMVFVRYVISDQREMSYFQIYTQ